MKAPALFFIGLLALPAIAQESHDIRIVNGKQVDLAPLKRWLAQPEGDRPLKHWKQLQVIDVKDRIGSWDRCSVRTETKETVVLFVENLPQGIKTFFQSVASQKGAIAAQEANIRSTEAKLLQAHAAKPTGAVGSAEYVDSLIAKRASINQWSANLTAAKEELGRLKSAHGETLEKHSSTTTVLAMFTGRKYAETEIWDCGTPMKP